MIVRQDEPNLPLPRWAFPEGLSQHLLPLVTEFRISPTVD